MIEKSFNAGEFVIFTTNNAIKIASWESHSLILSTRAGRKELAKKFREAADFLENEVNEG